MAQMSILSGSNWQNMLYQCLGKARCVIALMSPTYISSTVCREEYNIALARFLTKVLQILKFIRASNKQRSR